MNMNNEEGNPLIGSENKDIASEIQVINTSDRDTTESHNESSYTVENSHNDKNVHEQVSYY